MSDQESHAASNDALAGGEGAILDTADPNWRDHDPDRSGHSLIEAAEWFIECAYPPGAKYEVGKRFLFWQARDRLKGAIEEARTHGKP